MCCDIIVFTKFNFPWLHNNRISEQCLFMWKIGQKAAYGS